MTFFFHGGRMFGRRKKRKTKTDAPPPRVDPQALLAAQSVKRAILAALGITLLLGLFWMMLTEVTGRVFPWFSVVQAIFIGLAVRRFGRGVDWRFPLLAALAAWLGAFVGNLLMAIPMTSDALGVSAWQVVRGLTWWSFTTFFAEVITVVDYIYALFAGAVAAFYAGRRLNRHEEYALRTGEHL